MEVPDEDEDMQGGANANIIFVLEKATLETAKVGKNYAILNCDDHVNFLRKHKRDPKDYRPDILHQELLTILDSPLNKAGRVKAIYVNTAKNVLFRISPSTRIPRTFKRFSGLMVQLLQKLSIRATNGPEKLLRVIKQPVTKYLPVDARRVALSQSAPSLVRFKEYVDKISPGQTVVFFVGAFAHGSIDQTNADDFVSISEFPLSGACCLGRICNALENKYDIV